MNNLLRILIASLFMMLTTVSALAQDEEGLIPKLWKKITSKNFPTQKKSTGNINRPMPPMTREEMLKQIKYEIEANKNILERIKGLKKNKDGGGKEFYTYSSDKDTDSVNIEDLDTIKLKELSNKVSAEIMAYQANMVAQQMEVVRESQKVATIQQQIPRTPPPQPPRPPAPPVQPPRR